MQDTDIEKGNSVGMDITIKDLNFTVINKKREIKLLQNLTAKFPGAQLTALMGPSGSGKTTLLDIMAGRKSYGKIEGTLLYDQQLPSSNFLRSSVGYVEQFDTLIGNLTVTEMLQYTSEMKNPTAMPLAEKHTKVQAVIEQLNLDSCRDVKIGTPLARGVSGGQAKRINIGIALVSANTKVLLLDEPTSGLDSHTATQVMRVVKDLTTSSNITICATIHSPTPAIFQLFDNMTILLRGQLAYFGSAGFANRSYPCPACYKSTCLLSRLCDLFACLQRKSLALLDSLGRSGPWQLIAAALPSLLVIHCSLSRPSLSILPAVGLTIEFFRANNPEAHDIAPGENVSDYIVDLTTQADKEGRAAAFAEVYRCSDLRIANEKAVDAHSNRLDVQQNGGVEGSKRATTVGSVAGFLTILKYRSRRDFTDPQYLGPRIAERILLGFIIMSLYWHKGASNAASNINNVYSVLFLISILPGFTASAYIPVLVLERPLYYRELDDGLFRPITYLCAKLAGEFVIAAVGSLIFSWFVFFALELHGSYLLFLLVHYLTTIIGIALAYFIASISPNLEVANAALPAYVVTLLFFVGLLIRPADTPKYWLWYSKLDFLRYGWRAHMINQFQGQNAIFVDNTEVLEYFSITNSKWYWFGLQWLFGVGFFLLAWLGLTFVRYQKR